MHPIAIALAFQNAVLLTMYWAPRIDYTDYHVSRQMRFQHYLKFLLLSTMEWPGIWKKKQIFVFSTPYSHLAKVLVMRQIILKTGTTNYIHKIYLCWRPNQCGNTYCIHTDTFWITIITRKMGNWYITMFPPEWYVKMRIFWIGKVLIRSNITYH